MGFLTNPLYITLFVFMIIMIILYVKKPELIYDNDKKEFRQFGISDGKTLLPIHVIAILLAVALFVFFNFIYKYFDIGKTEKLTEKIDTKNDNKISLLSKNELEKLIKINDLCRISDLDRTNKLIEQISKIKLLEKLDKISQIERFELLNRDIKMSESINNINSANNMNSNSHTSHTSNTSQIDS